MRVAHSTSCRVGFWLNFSWNTPRVPAKPGETYCDKRGPGAETVDSRISRIRV